MVRASTIRLGLLFMAVVSALLPCAQGAFTIGPIASPANPIRVDGAEEILVPVAIDCVDVPASPVITVIPIKFEPVTGPAGITVTGAFSDTLDVSSCTTNPTGKAAQEYPFNVLASTLASSARPNTVGFTAKTQYPPTNAEVRASANATVTVAYRGLVTAKVPVTIQQVAPGGKVQFDFVIANIGNGPSVITLSDAPGSNASAAWSVAYPEPVVLNASESGRYDLRVIITAPSSVGWNNKEQDFLVRVGVRSAQDENKEGTSVTMAVAVRVRGFSAHSSPDAAAVLPGVLLVVAALALRRSKSDGE